jgi:acetylornithine deacetylase/succinyl-diaminopimelate desuccinylase-like protein
LRAAKRLIGETSFRTYHLFSCPRQPPDGSFQQGNDVPVIAFPIANHDDNQHAANENLRLQNLWDGLEVFAAFFSELGAVPNTASAR